MKKAFQWWIVCSSLDTSNFISHRLNSSTLHINMLCAHIVQRNRAKSHMCEIERETEWEGPRERVSEKDIDWKRVWFLFETKMFGIAVTKQVSFQVLRTTRLCVTVFARFYCCLLLQLLLPSDGINIIFKCDSQIPYRMETKCGLAKWEPSKHKWSVLLCEKICVWFVDRLLHREWSCRRPLEATSNKIARWRSLLASFT